MSQEPNRAMVGRRWNLERIRRILTALGKPLVNLLGSILIRPFIIIGRARTKPERIDPARILYVCLAFRGDFILNFPAIAALKRHFPKSRITCWVREYNRDLTRLNRDVDETVVYDAFPAPGILMIPELFRLGSHRSFIRKVRGARFDLMVDDTSLAFTALIGCLARIPLRIGRGTQGFGFLYHHSFPSNFKEHLTRKRMRLLEPLGIRAQSDDEVVPQLEIPSELLAEVWQSIGLDGQAAGYFTVQPFGGWEAKNWAGDRLVKVVCEFSAATGLRPIFIGGPDDFTSIEQMSGRLTAAAMNLAGRLDLSQTAALISGAKLHLGVDSVGAHIAVATGVKSLTIFGPTNPIISTCLTDRNIAVIKMLPCSPAEGNQYCDLDAGRLCSHLSCMRDLTAEDVLKALLSLWNGTHTSNLIRV